MAKSRFFPVEIWLQIKTKIMQMSSISFSCWPLSCFAFISNN